MSARTVRLVVHNEESIVTSTVNDENETWGQRCRRIIEADFLDFSQLLPLLVTLQPDRRLSHYRLRYGDGYASIVRPTWAHAPASGASGGGGKESICEDAYIEANVSLRLKSGSLTDRALLPGGRIMDFLLAEEGEYPPSASQLVELPVYVHVEKVGRFGSPPFPWSEDRTHVLFVTEHSYIPKCVDWFQVERSNGENNRLPEQWVDHEKGAGDHAEPQRIVVPVIYAKETMPSDGEAPPRPAAIAADKHAGAAAEEPALENETSLPTKARPITRSTRRKTSAQADAKLVPKAEEKPDMDAHLENEMDAHNQEQTEAEDEPQSKTLPITKSHSTKEKTTSAVTSDEKENDKVTSSDGDENNAAATKAGKEETPTVTDNAEDDNSTTETSQELNKRSRRRKRSQSHSESNTKKGKKTPTKKHKADKEAATEKEDVDQPVGQESSPKADSDADNNKSTTKRNRSSLKKNESKKIHKDATEDDPEEQKSDPDAVSNESNPKKKKKTPKKKSKAIKEVPTEDKNGSDIDHASDHEEASDNKGKNKKDSKTEQDNSTTKSKQIKSPNSKKNGKSSKGDATDSHGDSLPKRPYNAFILFSNDVRARLTEENPGINPKEMAIKIGKAYKALDADELKTYQDKASEAMAKFKEENPSISKVSRKPRDPNAPKRPSSAYLLFCTERREQVKKKNPNADFATLTKLVSEEYRALSEKQLRPYKNKSEKLFRKYKKDLETYKESNVGKVSS